MRTRTGGFRIGFRRGWSDWQKDLPALAAWAKDAGFEAIDHTRFAAEFADHITHVHAKDTEIITDNVYEIGLYQRSVFQKPYFCGEFAWRYTIPGHGVARWSHILATLEKAGFTGVVSVELEDADYNGTEQGERAGLTAALQYLQTA